MQDSSGGYDSEAFTSLNITDHRKNFKGDGAFAVPICHLSTRLSVLFDGLFGDPSR